MLTCTGSTLGIGAGASIVTDPNAPDTPVAASASRPVALPVAPVASATSMSSTGAATVPVALAVAATTSGTSSAISSGSASGSGSGSGSATGAGSGSSDKDTRPIALVAAVPVLPVLPVAVSSVSGSGASTAGSGAGVGVGVGFGAGPAAGAGVSLCSGCSDSGLNQKLLSSTVTRPSSGSSSSCGASSAPSTTGGVRCSLAAATVVRMSASSLSCDSNDAAWFAAVVRWPSQTERAASKCWVMPSSDVWVDAAWLRASRSATMASSRSCSSEVSSCSAASFFSARMDSSWS
mmetsp:Transcript_27153/g.87287  ORF Transcript_27153/g.87287 Transcript_27153/m.87287 type:complete len:292 (+) Transcript_27153:1806-2681(+)